MKLVRFGAAGEEKPGLIDGDGRVRSLEGVVDDVAGAVLGDASLARLAEIDSSSLPLVDDDVRLGPCVGQIGKILCIGLNYSDFAAKSGMDTPTQPLLFMKPTSTVVGPNDAVEIPRGSVKTDWEVELAVVIGKRAKYVGEDNALDYVAGYCVANDITEREYQFDHGGQWVKGKGCDTFMPLGPWLVTRDQVADPQNLSLWLEVDGNRYQDSSTDKMIFGVAHLVSYLSRYTTLYPGDVISTGSPYGVGLTLDPQVYLQAGQTMKLGVEGLGEQCQTSRACDT